MNGGWVCLCDRQGVFSVARVKDCVVICHEQHHIVHDSGEPEAWAAMAGVFRKLGNAQMAAWAEGRAELELLAADR